VLTPLSSVLEKAETFALDRVHGLQEHFLFGGKVAKKSARGHHHRIRNIPGWTFARSLLLKQSESGLFNSGLRQAFLAVSQNSSAASRCTEKIVCRSFYLFLLLTFGHL